MLDNQLKVRLFSQAETPFFLFRSLRFSAFSVLNRCKLPVTLLSPQGDQTSGSGTFTQVDCLSSQRLEGQPVLTLSRSATSNVAAGLRFCPRGLRERPPCSRLLPVTPSPSRVYKDLVGTPGLTRHSMPYKLALPSPLISPELVKSHLALISRLAYKAAVDSGPDGTGRGGLSLKQGCLFLLTAPIKPAVAQPSTELCQGLCFLVRSELKNGGREKVSLLKEKTAFLPTTPVSCLLSIIFIQHS